MPLENTNRVTVRLRRGDDTAGGDSAGTGTVLDHHLGVGAFSEFLRHQTDGYVGEAARPKRHHDADRPIGVGACALAGTTHAASTNAISMPAVVESNTASLNFRCGPASRNG
jgi:hypothetical protein